MNLLTGEGRVLAYFAQHPHATARTAAFALDLTERSIMRICGELESAGLMRSRAVGRGRHRHVGGADTLIAALLTVAADGQVKAVVA